MSASVLLIGIIPELVDFSAFPGLDAEKVRAGIAAQIAQLNELGYDAQNIYVDLGETAEAELVTELSRRSYDCVVFGAGIRVPPPRLFLFEKLLNVVHQKAPGAAICFNSGPGDSVDAVKRWV